MQLKRILLHSTALCLGLTVPLIAISSFADATCSSYMPHLKAGIVQDIQSGGTAEGYFIDSGTKFELPLTEGDKLRAFAGLGLTSHALMGGVRVRW
jgi:hypothetical protein